MTSKPALKPFDQQSSLRRVSSRKTLASTGGHSRLCVRYNTRRLRSRLRDLIRFDGKAPNETNYFTRRLPTELRLQIYEYVLQFDVPIKLDRQPRRTARSKIAGLLLANRLIYMEALPVLYDLNTIVIRRAELCRYKSSVRPQLSCKPALVQRLYVDDLHPSYRCVAAINRRWPAVGQPCENCRPSILPFVDALRQMPRLNEVFIDYYRHASAVQALAKGLHETADVASELQLTCVGIGRYHLTGEWLEGVEFELRNVPLVETWSKVTALPRPDPFLPYLRANRVLWKDLKHIEARCYDRRAFRRMVVQTLMLIAEHDSQLMPASFARVWPGDLPMDLRKVEGFGRPRFLHELNCRLQWFLDSGAIVIRDPVVRRP
ncbi:hypothetical protein LTR37_010578 [Vermiconidia calcicola]|uniref:Uncharacterized protein n=1 Tax=Vermiconidia calcicola TaxID=1690605 RepID=A0ACC3N4I2_9PEZI|nr:hypothetical protein LTR37_010578 [Vermiconidia calcicola]